MSLLLALQARTAADSLGTTDAATRVAQSFARGGADTLGTSDAATRAPQAPARTASDSLGTSDAATRAAALRTRTADDAAIALDLLDNFSTDTFGAGKYTYLTGSGVTVSAGTTSFPLGVEVVVTRNDRDPAVNWRLTSKRIRASANDINHGLVARVIDNNNYILMAQSGGILQILKKDGGSFSSLVGASPGADTSGQSYWLRATFIGDRLTLERFVADPLSNGPTHTLTYQLLGADATKFAGQPSLPGMRWLLITSAADATGDDFRIERVGTFDAAARGAQSFARTAADALGTSDSATRVVTYPRTTSDSLGTSDSATRAATSPTRAAADSLGTSDSAARLVTGTRTTADTLGTSDAAARGGSSFLRTAGDYASVINLITDPSFEGADLSQWPSDAGVTAAQSTSNATSRAKSMRTQGSLAGTGASITFPVVPGQRYLLRADVFVAAVGAAQTATAVISGGLTTSRSTTSGTTGQFSLVGATALATGTTAKLSLSSVGSGTFDFYWDAVALIPINAVATSYPYFDGGAAGDWLGTPEASASRLSDAAARAAALRPRSGSDSLGTSDAATRVLSVVRASADSLGTSDAATRASTSRTRTASDSLGTSDAAARAAAFARAASDTLGTSDAATRTLLTPRTAADSLGPVATGNATINATTADGSVLLVNSDSAFTWAQTVAALVGTSVDSSSNNPAAFVTHESAGNWDIRRAFLYFDTSSLPDNANVDSATLHLYVTAAGLNSMTSSVNVFEGFQGNAVTTGSFGEVGSVELSTAKSVGSIAPTPLYSDFALNSRGLGAVRRDGPTKLALRLIQDYGGTQPAPLDAAASLTFERAELGTNRTQLVIGYTVPTGAGVTDAATRVVAVVRTASESIGTSDAATRAAALRSRTGADSLGTSDAATTSGAAQASASDTLGTSDAASRAAASRARATADALATSDAAARAYAAIRQAQDSLAVSDQATRTLALVRQAIDALGTSDAADATFIPAPAGAFELFGTASTDPQFAGSAATRDRRPGSGGARDRAPASEGTREMVAGSASTRSMG